MFSAIKNSEQTKILENVYKYWTLKLNAITDNCYVLRDFEQILKPCVFSKKRFEVAFHKGTNFALCF